MRWWLREGIFSDNSFFIALVAAREGLVVVVVAVADREGLLVVAVVAPDVVAIAEINDEDVVSGVVDLGVCIVVVNVFVDAILPFDVVFIISIALVED